jgi:hypothetical protein
MGRKSLVHGVGINDSSTPVNDKGTWCPYYLSWKGMLKRCYDPLNLAKYPTYIGCSVCPEWLIFTNFRAWMKTQDWEGRHLDKDLLVPGNRVYSPETCIFVEARVNCFFLDGGRTGEYPTGVTRRKETNKLRARCRNPFTNKYEALGQYDSVAEAEEAWRKRKFQLAQQLADEQLDVRVKHALLDRFKSEEKN